MSGIIQTLLAGNQPSGIAVFTTTGANTWTVPTGVRRAVVECIAGGGNAGD